MKVKTNKKENSSHEQLKHFFKEIKELNVDTRRGKKRGGGIGRFLSRVKTKANKNCYKIVLLAKTVTE